MFDLVPDELQRSVIDSAREVAEAASKDTATLWSPIADSGLLGLGLPEECGGVGSGAAEEMLALTELGAALIDPTVLGSILAAHVIATDASAEREAGVTLQAVLDGEVRVGLADPWHWSFDAATPPAQGYRVVLPEGETAVTLAAAVTPNGVALVRLSEVELVEGIDRAAPLARATGAMIGTPNVELLDRALLLRAALQTGLSKRVLEVATEHAKARQQFGKPIGSFQAVKHHLAGMAVQVDAAQALVAQAAVLLDAGASNAMVARSAAVIAGRGAVDVCRTAIQVHGGIGVTDESEMHLDLRRAHLLEQVFGSPEFHVEWIVQHAS